MFYGLTLRVYHTLDLEQRDSVSTEPHKLEKIGDASKARVSLLQRAGETHTK